MWLVKSWKTLKRTQCCLEWERQHMNVNIVGENQGVNVQERTKEEEEINTNESELSGILITKMNREMNQELF